MPDNNNTTTTGKNSNPNIFQKGLNKLNEIEEKAKSAIQFIIELELGYTGDHAEMNEIASVHHEEDRVCFACGSKGASKLLSCSRCKVASYCSKECQIDDWKKRHKFGCERYKAVGVDMKLKTSEDKQSAVTNGVLSRIRFYSGPYAVHHYSQQGRGFVFIQSPFSLAEMSLTEPIGVNGQPLLNTTNTNNSSNNGTNSSTSRSILLHYLTMGEYDTELIRDDFELASIRSKLQDEVESYDPKSRVVFLVRFRCGYVGVLNAPLVPDYGICCALAKDYEGQPGALQLNIDDH